MKTTTLLLTAVGLAIGSSAATLEDWQFNDPNGTVINVVTNSGTVGTSWNHGGPRTQAGKLNIGDTKHYKWNTANTVTYRAANFADLTSGKYVFEYVVANWDLAGTNGVGITGNGIKFAVGGTSGTMQLEFEVATLGGAATNAATDIRVRSQNSNNGSLSGTDAQNSLGSLDLTNTAPVTVQLLADLDTGEWSTQVDYGNGFVDLVTDGMGMTSINKIQLIIDASNGTGWEYGNVAGVETEYILIDSATLSEQVPDPVWAVEFDGSSITNSKYISGTNYVLDTSNPALAPSNYFGQTLYAGVENVLGSVALSNAVASLSFADHKNDTWGHGGVRVQWNGPVDQTGLYEEDDKTTAIILFKKEDFLNGMDSGTVFMNATNDTLVAAVDFAPKDPARLKEANFRWVVQDAGQYYISTATTYTTDTAGDEHEITAEALDLSWFEYYPESSVSAISNAAAPSLQNIQALGFQMDATVATNTGTRQYHNFRVNSFLAAASSLGATPTSLWNDWVGGYPGVGANSGLLDHGDADGLDNLTEYAWGGDPSDGGSLGNTPVQAQVAEGGTNYIEYIYYERTDALDRGLDSLLYVGTDLVNTNWVDKTTDYITGTGVLGDGFSVVTNRVPTDADKKFIKLDVKFTP